MKKFLSLIILIGSLWFIITLTCNILTDNGIKVDVKTKENRIIGKVSSNEVDNMLSDVFNIYLNEVRYKVKIDYTFNVLEDETTNLELKIYFDGKEILSKVVGVNVVKDLEEPFRNEDIINKVLLTEDSFKIINSDKDYLSIKIGYLNNYGEYYLFNNKGNLLNEKAILAYDNKNYVNENDELLDIFYENNYYVKFLDNEMFVLELENGKNLKFKEYKYNINNNKINKELINTYENIKLVVNEE
ncbi:MAG: hypothetical protein NC483_01205 [Ruminococcus sp.]|nr:hypothetical protein [Ruminococcus sp.]